MSSPSNKQELESIKQELYQTKKQLVLSQTLHNDYQEEIQRLEKQIATTSDEYKAKVHHLEDGNISLKEEMLFLQDEVVVKNQEIEELLAKLKVTESCKDVERIKDVTEKVDLNDEISNLKQQTIVMTAELDAGKLVIQNSAKQNAELTKTIQALESEIENLKENNQCTKCNLQEACTLIETLQEELQVTRMNLDLATKKPLDDGAKGNSLFSEVYDINVKQKKYIQDMVKKYKEMKLSSVNWSRQVTQLRIKNSKLTQLLTEQANEHNADNEQVHKMETFRIEQLEDLLKHYKAEVQQRLDLSNTGLDQNHVDFVNNMVESAKRKLEKCRTDLDEKSSANLILAQQLRNANCEIRKLQVANQQMRNEMDKLVDMSNESKLSNASPDLRVADKSQSSVRSSVPEVNLNPKQSSIGVYVESDGKKESISVVVEADGNKENLNSENLNSENLNSEILKTNNTKPKVTFTEDTAQEPKVKPFGIRRGGRVLDCPPTIIHSKE